MARTPKNQPVDLSQRVSLTAGAIFRLVCPAGKQQAFLRDSEVPSLRVRVTEQGAKAFVFEAKLQGKTIRRTIGSVQAWSIDQARVEARQLSVQVDSKVDPREADRQLLEAKAQAKLAQERAAKFTLKALLTDYCDQLQRMGRDSHKKARGIFKLHVFDAAPELATKPACEITSEEITDLMRNLTEAGKDRTAGKLRSYARAAFEMARTVGTDSKLPAHFKHFAVIHNPVAETKSIDRETDKFPLSGEELRQYWRSIKGTPTFHAAVLRLHLLTGGQRLEQFSRLSTGNVYPDSILLLDGKGRPGKAPRKHPIPLIAAAVQALADIRAHAPVTKSEEGQMGVVTELFVISTDGGQTHVTANALSKWASAAGSGIADFQPKRIRSGVETALASLKVSSEERGQLLSHGIAGVQKASYDGFDYMDVKREALETLFKFLNGKG